MERSSMVAAERSADMRGCVAHVDGPHATDLCGPPVVVTSTTEALVPLDIQPRAIRTEKDD
ncbi:MAG: hypothetical protein M0020_04690 [Actinomycetota bacterium]|nr:hypothetical protein [Actinomycetota bacterium]